MKSISSSVVVLSGSAILIASCHGATNNVSALWFMGIIVTFVGIAGWVFTLIPEK